MVSFDFGGRIDQYKFCSALRLTVHLLSEGGFVAIFITYKGGRRDALEKSRAIQEAIVLLHLRRVNAKMESHTGKKLFTDLIQDRTVSNKPNKLERQRALKLNY